MSKPTSSQLPGATTTVLFYGPSLFNPLLVNSTEPSEKLKMKTGALLLISTLIILTSGCQRVTETNSNATANLNTNVNAPAANTNTNTSAPPISVIAAREPDKYKATLVFTAQTEGGEKTIGIPSLSAEVARNGADRRLSFKLPDGSDLIYLEHDGKPYVIAPGRKQYAELTPEATGFQIHKLMTPGQLVSYLDKLKGVEAAGEEQLNGRTALKYRYTLNAQTGTSAGQVSTESFVYVDKETGLPLRAELHSEASGNVQGVKAAKIVAEMRDITTDVAPTVFEIPAGLNKVPPEQVRAQIDAVTSTVAAVVRALLTNMNAPAAPAASPAATTYASPSK
jgi:hypothetical protein